MDIDKVRALTDAELEQALRDKGRLDWAREEFESQLDSEPHERYFDPDGYRRRWHPRFRIAAGRSRAP